MASGSSGFKKINQNRAVTGTTRAGSRNPQRAGGFGSGANRDVGF